jgi:hypothetical protein
MHTKANSARMLLGVASALQANDNTSAVADRKRVWESIREWTQICKGYDGIDVKSEYLQKPYQ